VQHSSIDTHESSAHRLSPGQHWSVGVQNEPAGHLRSPKQHWSADTQYFVAPSVHVSSSGQHCVSGTHESSEQDFSPGQQLAIGTHEPSGHVSSVSGQQLVPAMHPPPQSFSPGQHCPMAHDWSAQHRPPLLAQAGVQGFGFFGLSESFCACRFLACCCFVWCRLFSCFGSCWC
jgi:hypothetical protein